MFDFPAEAHMEQNRFSSARERPQIHSNFLLATHHSYSGIKTTFGNLNVSFTNDFSVASEIDLKQKKETQI